MNQINSKKTHFKMYKAGKRWLVAGVTVIGFGAGFGIVAPAKADTTNTNANSAQPSSQTPASAQTNLQAKQVPLKTTSAASQAASTTSTTSQAPSKAAAPTSATSQATSAAKVNTPTTVKPTSATSTVAKPQVATSTTATAVKTATTVKSIPTSAATNPQSAVITGATSAATTAVKTATAVKDSTSTTQTNVSGQSTVASQVSAAKPQSTASQAIAKPTNVQPVTHNDVKAATAVNVIKLAPDANDTDLAAAKAAAQANFAKTGQPQQIVRADATAVGADFTNGDFLYTVNSDGNSVTLKKYNGAGGAIMLSDKVSNPADTTDPTKTYDLTEIGNSSFMNKNITGTLTIPDSVTTIGDNAFLDDTITSLNMGPNVTNIGTQAFYNINEPTNDAEHNVVGNLDLSSITSLGMNAFGDAGVTSVKFGNNLTEIPSGAFHLNNNLSSVTFAPNADTDSKLTTIGANAFDTDQNIGTISIPDTVTTIGKSAFDTDYLSSVKFPKNLQTVGDSAFKNNFIDDTNPFPTGLISVGNFAFYGQFATPHNELKSINLSKIQNLGISAFQNAGLTNITLNDTLTSISQNAFSNNSKLTTVTLPTSVKTIGISAFQQDGLITLDLSSLKSLTNIQAAAFYANALTDVKFPDSVTNIDQLSFTQNSLKTITLPASLQNLGVQAFAANKLTSIGVIPAGVTQIPWSAFRGNKLTTVKIPDTVKDIGPEAFKTNNIRQVVLPKNVTFSSFKSGDKTIQVGNVFADQQFGLPLPGNTSALKLSYAVLGINLNPASTDPVPEDKYNITNFESNIESSATGSQYDTNSNAVSLKKGTTIFTLNFVDTTHPEVGFSGQFIGTIDQSKIILNSATDKTADTINIKRNDTYTPAQSIKSVSDFSGRLTDPNQMSYLKADETFPSATSLLNITPVVKVLENNVNTAIPGKYTVTMTTNGPFQPTSSESPDMYKVVANVNVNQTYTWKFTDQNGNDLTDAIDPTTTKAAVTTIDKPAESYTVSLPKTLTVNAKTYYLMAEPDGADTLAWTTPTASFEYTDTDSAAITGKTAAAVALNSAWNTAAEASVLAGVTEPNSTVMTAAQIQKALEDGTITTNTVVDTSTLATPTDVTFTYHYATEQKQVTVSVDVTQAPVLKAKNVTVFLNDKKDADGAAYDTAYPVYDSKDEDGYDLDADGTILVNGQSVSALDTSKTGTQTFNYSYQDAAKLFSPVTATATVTVVDDTAVTAPDTYYVKQGTAFSPQQIITRLTSLHDVDTKTAAEVKAALDSGALKIDKTVDTSKLGSTTLTYSYTDGGKTVTGTTKVVVASDPVINLNPDITIGLGNIFKSSSLFKDATDENGNPLTLKQVHVTSDVNENKAATYPVSYSYDYQGLNDQGIMSKQKVFVTGHVTVADETDVKSVPSVTVLTNDDTFDPLSLILSATRADGTNLTASELKQAFADGDLKIIGQYDMQTVGTYPISFAFKGHEYMFSPSVINVTEQPKILVHSPLTFSLNSEYGTNGEEASLEYADDEYGNKLALDKLTVDQQVNTKVPGHYNVVFSYQDAAKLFKPVTATAVVIVNDNTAITSQTATTTLTQGQQFDPYTLVKDVINTDGNKLTEAQVAAAIKNGKLTTQGLDTSKLGPETVTFAYSDGGKQMTSTSNVDVTVPVKLSVKSPITVNMNTSYDPSMSYLSGTDQYGNAVPLSAVAVTNLPDINTAATYHVTFHYLDATTTADVIVKDAASMEVTHDVTVQKGTIFDPLSAISSITKPNGAPMSRAELEAAYNGKKILTVTGVANTNVVGTYGIDYSYDDPILGHTDVHVVDNSTSQPTSEVTTVGSETPGSTSQSVASQAGSTETNSIASQAQSQGSQTAISQASQNNSETRATNSVASQAQNKGSQVTNSQASQTNSTTNSSASQAQSVNSQSNSQANSTVSQVQSENNQTTNSQASQTNSTTNSSASQAQNVNSQISSQADSVVSQNQNSQTTKSQASQTNSTNSQTQNLNSQNASQTSQGDPVASNAPTSQTTTGQTNSMTAISVAIPTSGVTSQGATLNPTPVSQAAKSQAGKVNTVSRETTSQNDQLQPTAVDQPTNPQKATMTTNADNPTTAADDLVTTAPAKTTATIHLTKSAAQPTAATKLPQTNEQDTSALVMAMLGMSLLLGAYFISDQKRFDK